MKTLIIVLILAFLVTLVYFGWTQFNKEKTTTPAPTSQIGQILTPTPPAPTSDGVRTAPPTGVNLWVFLFGSLSLGLAGWYLVKKAKI